MREGCGSRAPTGSAGKAQPRPGVPVPVAAPGALLCPQMPQAPVTLRSLAALPAGRVAGYRDADSREGAPQLAPKAD